MGIYIYTAKMTKIGRTCNEKHVKKNLNLTEISRKNKASKMESRGSRISFSHYVIVAKCADSEQDYMNSNPGSTTVSV